LEDEAKLLRAKYYKQWYESNKQAKDAYKKKWNQANKDKVKRHNENYWAKKAREGAEGE